MLLVQNLTTPPPRRFLLHIYKMKGWNKGGGVRKEREEWAETVTKTMKHMGWQDFKLGGWVGLTHVALVLGYNLAF